MLRLLLLSAFLFLIAILALAIRIIIKPRGEFSGGSCSAGNKPLADKGISCICSDPDKCHVMN